MRTARQRGSGNVEPLVSAAAASCSGMVGGESLVERSRFMVTRVVRRVSMGATSERLVRVRPLT